MATLRRRLEQSDWLAGILGRIAAGYVRLCRRTSRWESDGFDALEAAAMAGPVMLVTWHSRILMAPADMEGRLPFTTLRERSPAGRVSGAMQARFGHSPVEMTSRRSNQAASRAVMKRLREGGSVALTADGPKGPALVMKSAPLDWARVTGAPVFLYAWSGVPGWRLRSWDRLLVPRPFARGCSAVARWEADLPRRADAAALEALRAELEAALTAHQARVDAALGIAPGP